jgi:hypothetical protein
MFAVVAFVPVEDVYKAFEAIALVYPAEWKKYSTFVKYFEKTYIGEKKVGRKKAGESGRKDPLFAIASYNVNKRTLNGEPRTSNNVEGWHSALNYCHLGSQFNHILKVVKSLQLEQSHTQNLNVRLDTGTTEHRRKNAYAVLDERITSVLKTYSVDDIAGFMKKMTLIVELIAK